MIDGKPIAKYKAQSKEERFKPQIKGLGQEYPVQKSLQYSTVYSSSLLPGNNDKVEVSQIINKQGGNLCFIEGPTMEKLFVHVRDTGGRPAQGMVTVDIDGPNGPVDTQVQDTGHGYLVTYEPLNRVPGDYVIKVFVNLVEIAMFNITTQNESTQLVMNKKANPSL